MSFLSFENIARIRENEKIAASRCADLLCNEDYDEELMFDVFGKDSSLADEGYDSYSESLPSPEKSLDVWDDLLSSSQKTDTSVASSASDGSSEHLSVMSTVVIEGLNSVVESPKLSDELIDQTEQLFSAFETLPQDANTITNKIEFLGKAFYLLSRAEADKRSDVLVCIHLLVGNIYHSLGGLSLDSARRHYQSCIELCRELADYKNEVGAYFGLYLCSRTEGERFAILHETEELFFRRYGELVSCPEQAYELHGYFRVSMEIYIDELITGGLDVLAVEVMHRYLSQPFWEAGQSEGFGDACLRSKQNVVFAIYLSHVRKVVIYVYKASVDETVEKTVLKDDDMAGLVDWFRYIATTLGTYLLVVDYMFIDVPAFFNVLWTWHDMARSVIMPALCLFDMKPACDLSVLEHTSFEHAYYYLADAHRVSYTRIAMKDRVVNYGFLM